MLKTLQVSELKTGDILYSDIKSEDGRVLIAKGTKLTDNLVERLRHWAQSNKHIVSIDVLSDENHPDLELLEKKTDECIKEIKQSSEKELPQAIASFSSIMSHIYDDLKTIHDLPEDAIKIEFATGQGNHYFRVSRMAVALAHIYNEQVAPAEKISLQEVCLAALLHDYGKRYSNDRTGLSKLVITDYIFSGSGISSHTLSAGYNESYHTVYSYVALKGYVPDSVREMILCTNYRNQHMEKDRKFKKVLPAASIISICDIYDTLLTHVVKKDMEAPFENVISYMSQLAHNNRIDNELYKLFLKHLPVYQRGAKVLLSTGEYAIVTERSAQFPTRPTVLTLTPSKQRLIDLSETTNITIIKNVYSDDNVDKIEAVEDEQLRHLAEKNKENIPEAEGTGVIVLDKESGEDRSKISSKLKSVFRRR